MTDQATPPPQVTIHGDATDEEVAALVAALVAAPVARPERAPATPPGSGTSLWAHPARSHRATLRAGPGAWRASGLPG